MIRPVILAALSLSVVGLAPVAGADKRYGPGVTDTEIKIGQTVPYSGPISSLSRALSTSSGSARSASPSVNNTPP